MVTLLLICTTPQAESFGKGGTPELISDKGMQTVFKKVLYRYLCRFPLWCMACVARGFACLAATRFTRSRLHVSCAAADAATKPAPSANIL